MSLENAAAVTMNRINLVFAKYEAALCTVLRDDTVPQHMCEEAAREGVIVEANFRKCRNLYDMNKELFLETYGEVHAMDDADILQNLLLCEVQV